MARLRIAAAFSYVAACTYLWHAQRQLIFVPEAAVDRTPADVGLQFVEIQVPVTEHSFIATWWLPHASTAAEHSTVLYLHGNDGNLARELGRLRLLHGYGFAVFAIDYRGFGRSSGPFPSEAQVYDDAVAAWNYLVDVQKIEPGRIVIYGHSLGAAVAAELALRRGAACAAVLESSFTSISDMAHLEYPWVPVDLLLDQHFDVLGNIARVKVPLVLVHGSADRRVPSVMSERLHAVAHAPKRVVLVDGGSHDDAVEKGVEAVRRAIAEVAPGCLP